MSEARHRFHQELDALETEIVDHGRARRAGRSQGWPTLWPAATTGWPPRSSTHDDEIDDRYLEIERRILDLLARQTPVASDLRLVSAILHISLHLERVGDQAVNIAKIATATRDLPTDETRARSSCRRWPTWPAPCSGRGHAPSSGADLELAPGPPGHGRPGRPPEPGHVPQVVALAEDPQAARVGHPA